MFPGFECAILIKSGNPAARAAPNPGIDGTYGVNRSQPAARREPRSNSKRSRRPGNLNEGSSMTKTSTRFRTLAILLAGLLLGLGHAGGAGATTVTVDGIRTAGEYSGANNGTESLLWWNDHHSIYTKAAANMNTLYWEINQLGASDFSLNIFVEVPDYARRMIWVDDCKYKDTGTFDADCAPIPLEFLDAYFAGSHHDDVNMSYGTQTGSEYFQLNGLDLKIKLQDEDDKADDFTWKTSREYLLGNGICTLEQCLAFTTTMSLELMYLGLATEQAALDKIASITDMQLHLSDEARGLPPIPIPATFWLFGTALFGLVGIARRKAASR